MTKKFYLLFVCFIISIITFSQPNTGKTYAETKREQDQRAYNNAYNNSNSVNYNRSSGRGGVNQVAVNQLADQFRRNAGKTSSSNSSSYDSDYDDDDDDYIYSKSKSSSSYSSSSSDYEYARKKQAEREARLPIYLSEASKLESIGFTKRESLLIADRNTPFAGDVYYSLKEIRTKDTILVSARKRWMKIRDTASFNISLKAIYQVRRAGVSATQALQWLANKYPDKRSFLEVCEFETLPYVYDLAEGDRGKDYKAMLDEEIKYADKRFWELYAKYPKEGFKSIALYSKMDGSPCDSYIKSNLSINEKNKYRELLVLGKCTYSNNYPFGDLRTWTDEKYWKSKPMSYWKDYADLAGISVVDVLGRFAGYDDNDMKTFTDGRVVSFVFRPDMEFLLKKLANDGDASAMNGYGFRLAVYYKSSKSDKRAGYDWLRKAVKNGSVWARINLLYLSGQKQDEAPDAEKTKQETLAYLNTLSPAEKFSVVQILMVEKAPFIKVREYVDLAYKLCEEAAAGGHQGAKNGLKWEGWNKARMEAK